MTARLVVVRECYECPNAWPARTVAPQSVRCQEMRVQGDVDRYDGDCPLRKTSVTLSLEAP